KTRARDGEPLEVKILPLRLEADVADKMDEAWRAKGIKNRMEFFRGAIGHYLAHLGARHAAALFTTAGATGARTRRNRRGVGRPTTASDAPCPRNLAAIQAPENTGEINVFGLARGANGSLYVLTRRALRTTRRGGRR